MAGRTDTGGDKEMTVTPREHSPSASISPDRLLKLLARQLSGERIKSIATDIYGFDRFFRFPGFRKSAAYCRDRLKRAGLEDVKITSTPADGKTRIHDYVMPMGWDAEDATLTVNTPLGKPRVLASYKEEPVSLFNYSAPTPKQGVTAQVVHAPDLAALERMKNLKGKIVLIHHPFSRRTGYLVAKAGGIGVIADWAGFNMFSPEGVNWDNYTFFPDNPFRLFGFSISRKDSAALQRQVAKAERTGAKVMAHAVVRTRLYEDRIELVQASLRGRTDEEVIGFAHLFEFGAWDNAAGCAVLLEAAAVLQQLIEKQKLPRPRRTITFLHGWECYGPVAYLARHKRHDRIVAGLNVDGVGVDMSRMMAPLCIFKNPESNPSFTDPLLQGLLRNVLPLSNSENVGMRAEAKGGPHDVDSLLLTWKATPFGGCDGLPADPWFNVPFPSLVQFSKSMWHNTLDTPEALCPEPLESIALVAATYLYAVADAGSTEALSLARRLTTDAEHLLRRTAQDYSERILAALSDRSTVPSRARVLMAEAEGRVNYLRDLEAARLESLHALAPRGECADLDALLPACQDKLARTAVETMQETREAAARHCAANRIGGTLKPLERKPSATERQAMRMVPERLMPGILTLEALPEKVRYTCKWEPGYQVLTTPILWTDGKRSLYEIAQLVEQETGKVDLPDLIACFKFLEKHGYVKVHRA